MTFKNCIDAKAKKGTVDKDQAADAKRMFDEHHEALRAAMGETEAQRAAADRTKAELRKKASDKKRQTILQARAAGNIRRRFDQYRNGKGNRDDGKAALALLDPFDPASTETSVMGRWHRVQKDTLAQMTEVLERFRRTVTGGTRNRADQDAIVDAAFGGPKANDAARQMFEAWSTAAEYLRKRFNAAGGSIPKREDWGLPQHWDSARVRAVSYQEWRAGMFGEDLSRLARDKMIDERTGLPFTDEALELELRKAKDTIDTEGFNKVRPSGQARGRSFANRRSDHRFLVFKDGAAWRAAHERFGKGTVFDVMVAHIELMSRDIALMEILGPNPRATQVFVRQLVEKNARLADARTGGHGNIDAARRATRKFDDMLDIITGRANRPVGGWFPAAMASARNILTSAYLGSTALLAVSTDRMTVALTAKMNGLSATRELGRFLDIVRPGGAANLALAARAGFVAESWTAMGAAMSRYVGEFTGPEWSRRIADTILRASLLNRVTEGARASFSLEFAGALADHAGTAWKDLPEVLRDTFARYGMGESHWDIIRATPQTVERGAFGEATFLSPADILRREDLTFAERNDLATRVGEMIDTEMQFAVPTATVRARADIMSNLPPGTVGGELLRSAAMFKNFPMTIKYTHIDRGLGQTGVPAKLAYLGTFFTLMTLGGAAGLQMREIAKGRDPRPMTDPEFWGAAALNGGGIGIVGDFLFSNLNRFGGGPLQTAAGPVLELGQDITNLTFGNVYEAARGDDTHFGRELIRFLKNYTPGNSLWYARLGLERLVFDQLSQAVDPEFYRSARRTERRWEREFGQRYWWAPGDDLPRRAPDFGNVAEERPR